MTQADPQVCSEYIVSAGMNCYRMSTHGIGVPEQALITAEGNLNGFADGLSPTICQIVNGFINNATGMWLDIISAATTIIEAIKKALSNPKKLATAVRKMADLARSLLSRIQSIANFLTSIPEAMEGFALAQINKIKSDFEAMISDLDDDAKSRVNEKRLETIDKLSEQYEAETDPAKRASLLARIEALTQLVVSRVMSVVTGSNLTWPELPSLVFGLDTVLNAIINAIPIPTLGVRTENILSEGDAQIDSESIKSKLEATAHLTNAKISAVNSLLEPFVLSFNLVVKFIQMLLKADLKGVLKWLISLPKKIIDTYLGAAMFGMDFVVGLTQGNPLLALESWANDKFRVIAENAVDRAGDYAESSLVDNFVSEIFGLFALFTQGNVNAIKDYIFNKTAQYGSAFGSVVEFTVQLYAGFTGGFKYVLSVITSDLAPILGLIGFSTSMFSPNVSMNPNTSAPPEYQDPVDSDIEVLDTVYKQRVNSSMVILELDENGAPIPLTSSGLPVPPGENGVRPVDPDRPIIPYGYFRTNSNGVLIEDSDGIPIRVNESQYANTTLLPLTDPDILIRLQQPDYTQWLKLWDQPTPEANTLRSPSTDTPILTFGFSNRRIKSELKFYEMPYIAVPTPDQQTGVSVSEYISEDAMASGLDSPTDPPEARQLYQGKFVFTRKLEYFEFIYDYRLEQFIASAGRDPITIPEVSVIEETSGYYNYSKFNNSLQFRITTSPTYTGPRNGSGYDLNRYPTESELIRVFYKRPNVINVPHYDNAGRLYLDNNSYRFGLLDNNNDVNIVLRPEESGFEWDNAYTVPSGYRFTNTYNAGIETILSGGKLYNYSQSGLSYASLSSGLSNVYLNINWSDIYPSEAYLFLMGPEDQDFVQVSLQNDGTNYWSAVIDPITITGTYSYYYAFKVSPTQSGYVANATEPFEYEIT